MLLGSGSDSTLQHPSTSNHAAHYMSHFGSCPVHVRPKKGTSPQICQAHSMTSLIFLIGSPRLTHPPLPRRCRDAAPARIPHLCFASPRTNHQSVPAEPCITIATPTQRRRRTSSDTAHSPTRPSEVRTTKGSGTSQRVLWRKRSLVTAGRLQYHKYTMKYTATVLVLSLLLIASTHANWYGKRGQSTALFLFCCLVGLPYRLVCKTHPKFSFLNFFSKSINLTQNNSSVPQ